MAGSLGADFKKVLDIGVDAVLPICLGPMTLEQAMRAAPELLADTAEQALRLMMISRDKPSC